MNFPTSLAFFRWRPAAWLRVTGSDAPNFLQGQFTNDLRNAPASAAIYGLWLNVKGKIVADSFVLRGAAPEEFWVGSYFSTASAICERLESFVIADDVVIEDVTGDWAGISLLGDGAGTALAQEKRDGFVFRGRRTREENAEWIFPAATAADVRAQLAGLRELDAEEMARRRITAGIPAVPADLGLGDLPNEGGLDADAISYTKGCYLGQEVMARLKSMGQVRRRLLRVAATGEKIPALPAPLLVGARQVGELRSAARDGRSTEFMADTGGFVGLAMLSLLHVEKNARLAFAADAAPVVHLLDSP